jgi:hypothetical protein
MFDRKVVAVVDVVVVVDMRYPSSTARDAAAADEDDDDNADLFITESCWALFSVDDV